jgi:hypothetical protein
MNMIRREAVTTTGICYAQQQIAHNKYLPQFFVCNNNLIYHHYIFLSFIYYRNFCGGITHEYIR